MAKQKAGIEIKAYSGGKYQIEKNLPVLIESSEVMAAHVEALIEKMEQEAVCADEDDVTDDVTAGTGAATESEAFNEDTKCVEHEVGNRGAIDNPGAYNDVTIVDVSDTVNYDSTSTMTDNSAS